MTKEAVFTIKLESQLRSDFMAEAAAAHRPVSQVLRELMRDYVQRQREAREYNDSLVFERLDNGIEFIIIENPLATAKISLYGGQVLAWQPKSQKYPVLWQSDLVKYRPGKAIRAGVPVCWPWFGSHPSQAELPSHGIARTSNWSLISSKTLDSGETEILLAMPQIHADIQAKLDMRISIGNTLSIELITTNTGDHHFTFTEALHTYFRIGDIRQIKVDGLSGCHYVDQIDHHLLKQQSGLIGFCEEVDRVYINTVDDCLIQDALLDRTIKISKSSSKSTVVWNPWISKASKMDDLGPVDWQSMVCIESANALENTVVLAPAEQHTLAVNYSVFDHGEI